MKKCLRRTPPVVQNNTEGEKNHHVATETQKPMVRTIMQAYLAFLEEFFFEGFLLPFKLFI